MKNVLIVSGHPDLSQSIANAAILDEFAKALPAAQIRKLDTLYAGNKPFNIKAEQEAILAADVIVWQFPLSWYSLPGLMKKWLDEVFVHGFAHGSQGKLGGKKLLISFTAGAPDAVYQKDGFFGYTMDEYFPQFACTAKLCGLDLVGVEYVTGISFLERSNQAAVDAQKAQAVEFAQKVIKRISDIA